MTPIARACLLAACAVPAMPAAAQQNYPDRPIRLIVGFAPGGAADLLGRITAQSLSDALGEQIVVDNRPGAGALVATEIASRATPDGYTLLFTSPPHAINVALYNRAKYDPIKDFDPVVHVVSTALILTVNAASPFKSVQELVAYARKNPGKLDYGSGGAGASGHLAMELLKSVTGVDIVHVPYKGTGPVLTDLIGGQIDMTIGSAAPTIPQVKAGKLRALAVTSKNRSVALPDVPSIAESGFPAYEVTQWFGIVAPDGLPKPVIGKLNAAMNQALKQTSVRDRFLAASVEPVGGTPEALGAVIAEEVQKWGKLVRKLGLKVE